MSKRVTIYDLAKILDVSTATVSRALNDHKSIKESTKDRIRAAANEYGYRTNKFAVNLSKQKSNTIGVIVPRLNSYFMSTVLSGIEKVANEVGYNLIISQSFESQAKEKMNAKTLFDSGVDALLVSLASETNDYEHFTIYKNRNIPLLFFDRTQDLTSCPSILIDNKTAGYEATDHLISRGCRNILHISGNLQRNVYKDRFQGYLNALKNYDIIYGSEYHIETDLESNNIESTINHIQNLQKIDGIFISNDTFAVHVIKGLLKAGYDIPKDIKIIGFNNDPVSEVISPNLTTIDYPGYEMGVLAGQSIINHLKGNINIKSAETILLKHKLIIRESTSHN